MSVFINCKNCNTSFDVTTCFCPGCNNQITEDMIKQFKKRKANNDTCLGFSIALVIIIIFMYMVITTKIDKLDNIKRKLLKDGSYPELNTIIRQTLAPKEKFKHIETTYWEKDGICYIKTSYFLIDKHNVKTQQFIIIKLDKYGDIEEMVDSGSEGEPSFKKRNKRAFAENIMLRGVKYKVVSGETRFPYKRSVNVFLTKKIDKKGLSILANRIKKMDSRKFKKTFIGFYIYEIPYKAYWATTHFNPKLEIQVIGISLEKEKILRKASLPKGAILGSWIFDLIRCRVTIYKVGGAYYVESLYGDKSKKIKKLTQKMVENREKYLIEDDYDKGYYIIKGKKLIYGDKEGDFSYTRRIIK